MAKSKPEWVETIKGVISAAYDAGEIQSFEDFDRVFLNAWNSLGINDGQKRGSTLRSVCADNSVIVALRQKEAEANRPITENSPIEYLPISDKLLRHLSRGGLHFVGDIISLIKKEGEGYYIRNVGKGSKEEIREALKWAGIEIPQPSDSCAEDLEKAGEIEEEPALGIYKVEPLARMICLEPGETFRTEFPLEGSNPWCDIRFGTKLLTVKAQRIVIEVIG